MRAAFTTKPVNSAGVSLASRDYGGPGPALVLMHGAGMDQGSLEPLAAHLRPAFRVVTFDFRGHGGTDLAPWTVASAVQDLSAVAAAYGLGTPAVGGHSLGGMVAAAYARAHATCPGAINIDGHGRGRVDQYPGHDAAEVLEWWRQQDQRFDWLTSGLRAKALLGLSRLLRKPTTTAEVARQVMREIDAVDLFALYRQLSCPLLVFNATAPEDRYARKRLMGKGEPLVRAYRTGLARDLTRLAEECEHVTAVEVAATHMLITTHAELVAQQISTFLLPHQVPA